MTVITHLITAVGLQEKNRLIIGEVKIIYLASPYHHPDPLIMELRYEEVSEVTAKIMVSGRAVYSPIAHNHPIAVRYTMPRDWEFWQALDLPMLAIAQQMWILTLDGWRESRGVTAERAFAVASGIPVREINQKDWLWPR